MKRLIVALLLILLPVTALAVDYPARVVGITDGDTLTVLKADRTQVKIRLAGIGSWPGWRPRRGRPDAGYGASRTRRRPGIGGMVRACRRPPR